MGCIFLGVIQKAESSHIPGISKPFQPPKLLGPAKKPGNIGCLQMLQCKLKCADVGSDEAQLLWGSGTPPAARGAAGPETPTPHGCSSTERCGKGMCHQARQCPVTVFQLAFQLLLALSEDPGVTSQAVHSFGHLLL